MGTGPLGIVGGIALIAAAALLKMFGARIAALFCGTA